MISNSNIKQTFCSKYLQASLAIEGKQSDSKQVNALFSLIRPTCSTIFSLPDGCDKSMLIIQPNSSDFPVISATIVTPSE